MRRRIHVCHMRRRIHVCHMRRRIHISLSKLCDSYRYAEKDPCMSCEERRRIHVVM